jgi:osmoprotectant transport system ATP-binding protein
MDEPFAAVDPIARDRLQAEFLRLQDQVHKTIVFVTHDIDEAIRLGSRIAVMRTGGFLEQYADPQTLLSDPATDFVADFVGSERTLRRLSVLHVGPDGLVDWPRVSAGADVDASFESNDADWLLLDGDEPRWVRRTDRVEVDAGTAELGTTLSDALASYLAHEGPGVLVRSEGQTLGVLTGGEILRGARRR